MTATLPAAASVVDRQQVIQAYRDNRVRTQVLFEMLTPDAYYEQPIPLRHPVVFYEGHIPAFAVNSFLKKGLGYPGLDSDLEALFARGIDPGDHASAAKSAPAVWPTRDEVRRYAETADDVILKALESDTIEREQNGSLYRGQGVFTMLEHEVMHQETLLYMWHQFGLEKKRRPAGYTIGSTIAPVSSRREMVTIPAGRATLGATVTEVEFGWDNEFPTSCVDVPAFAIDLHNVTNAGFLAFVEAGGYNDASFWTHEAWERLAESGRHYPWFWELIDGDWYWRGMFDRVPLPLDWPVYVTHDEASAFARWRRLRLPTEAEYHRAAYGTPAGTERSYPWGDGKPDPTRGNFDFSRWDPVPIGSSPDGASAWGVQDLVGNGWEWTSTVFDGFPGFEVMASYPEYSADFFDGDHFVVKGASPATGRGLIRRSFRNWFRPSYPYMYASFRCVKDDA